METPLLATLTTLDNTLLALSTSLSTHAPNLPAAQKLLSTDATLSRHLATLATHTSHTIQLAHLHSLAENLSAKYRAQIQTLAEVRRQILAAEVKGPKSGSASGLGSESKTELGAGAGTGIESGHGVKGQEGVDYKTVLAFARNLSRYTAPRGFKTPSVLRAEAEAEAQTLAQAQAETENEGQGQGEVGKQMRNGDTTAIATAANEAQPQSQPQPQSQSQPQSQPQSAIDITMADGAEANTGDRDKDKDRDNNNNNKNPGLESLDQEIKAWLDPQLQVPFLPWPSEEMIARSSLARITGWAGAVEADAASEDLAAQNAKLEAEREAERKREEDERRAEYESRPRETQQVQRPKVFQGLDLYDPDEED